MTGDALQLRPEPGQKLRAGQGPGPVGTLARVDALLRLALAAVWIGTAAASPDPLLRLPAGFVSALDVGLVACGLIALGGAAPRATAAAGLAASLLRLPVGTSLAPWIAVLGAAGVRCVLHFGPSADRLSRIHALAVGQTFDLMATELRRAEAAQDQQERESALSLAGDAFERAARARRALGELGLERGASFAGARALGRGLAALLASSPRLRAAVARRLEAAGRRRAGE